MIAPPSAKTITVLLVDDFQVVRQGCRHLLESAPDIQVVGEAATGESALALYRKLAPDVLILDLSLPDIGGLETLRRIIASDAKARVLVFSMHDDETTILQCLETGASGYLAKSSGAGQILEAVRQVMAGKLFIDTERATELLTRMMAGAGKTPLEILTLRETELLRHFAEGQSVAEIAAALFISPKTVAAHRNNIMKKLKLKNIAQLVRMAIRYKVIRP